MPAPDTTTTSARPRTTRPRRVSLLLCAVLLPLAMSASAGAQQQLNGEETFATVGEKVITVEEYVVTLRSAIRNSYYHGQIPPDEMARFQRDVADDLVDRVLLAAEAKRLGIEADPQRYAAQIASIEQRYADDAEFQKNRDALLASLSERLAEKDRIEQLEARTRAVPPPSEEELRAYYEANLDKFQEPEQIKVSAVLLVVDPSAPRETWNAAREEAARLRERITDGEDFAEVARLHSGDASAENGGDMGYLHRGMLGEPAQVALDALQPGDISAPVDLLEGIALFRLDDRKAARQNDLDAVRDRAVELLQRDRAEQAWQALKEQLRERTAISMRQDLFLPESDDPAAVHGSESASGTAQ